MKGSLSLYSRLTDKQILMPSFGDVIVLEPVSLASLPPEHVITDEEFEKEIDLTMMDSGSMDVESYSAHDLVSNQIAHSYLIISVLYCLH